MIRTDEVTPTKFAEVGRPYLMRRAGHRVALCSAFDRLYWPGRATYDGHKLRHRLSLYSADLSERIVVFDGARFPINDVAFHPSEPWLAIGTGTYDGGYAFEGELLLWNVETGEQRSLLRESREVVRCRFDNTRELTVLLRPRYEDEFDETTAFDTYVGTTLDATQEQRSRDGFDPRLEGLQPIAPVRLGFEGMVELRSSGIPSVDLQHLHQAGFEERHRVWDVAWLSDERVALVHDCCELEVWCLPNRREVVHQGGGRGVQLFAAEGRLLVHTLAGDPREQRSTLLALREGSLVEWRAFPNACAFSMDALGRLLARDVGHLGRRRGRLDRVVSPSGQISIETDLGHYDCINHYVRIDGGDGLYFLRGTPLKSHKDKRLCAVDPDGAVREIMTWDDQGEHLIEGCAAFVGRDHLLRGFHVYGPRNNPKRLELYSLAKRSPVWSLDVDADVTALCVHDATRSALFALADGRLGVIDLDTGATRHDELLAIDGIASVAMSIAVRGDSAAVGTIDGRLLLYRIRA